MSERRYYLIEKDSPVMGVIEKALCYQKEFHEFMESLKKEFGAAHYYSYGGDRFCGLVFDSDVPKGWRLKAGEEFCVPDKRLKVGRDIAERIRVGPRGVDSWRFSGMVGSTLKEEYTPYVDSHIHFTLYEKHGEKYILSVPRLVKAIPTGCAELKMSEYWRIVEEAKAVAA